MEERENGLALFVENQLEKGMLNTHTVFCLNYTKSRSMNSPVFKENNVKAVEQHTVIV